MRAPSATHLLSLISLFCFGVSLAAAGDVYSGKAENVSCPVKCFKTDPVCGANGITYWCGCVDAQCAGVTVAKSGFCQVGSGVGGEFSSQALLLVHIVWLVVLGFSVVFGLL